MPCPKIKEILPLLHLLTLLITAALSLQAYKHRHNLKHNRVNAAFPSPPRQ
jgi:hypothetical protein